MESSYLRLTARAANQHGAFTKSQAAEFGVASSVLSRRVKNGSLIRPYEGVYVVAGSAATWERSVIVAVYSSAAGAVASHATACHLYDLTRRPRRIEVSVPGDSRPVRDHIIHRSTDLIPADIQLVKGIPCTSPARTLVDSGIPWGVKFAGRCLDEGVRRGLVTDAEIASVLHRVGRKGRNGVGPIRLVLVTRLGWAGLTESQIEAELFRLLREAGINLPEAQVRIHRRGGAIIARVDFIFHEVMLVIELDGFNFHADPQSFRRDRRSQNALVLEGYRVLRFSAWDVMAAPEYVISQVVAALVIAPASALGGENWRSGPVRTAAGFLDRWRGLRPRSVGSGLLLEAKSVHSFGMKEDLWICGLRDMKVVAVRKLVPARVAWLRGVDLILELPIEIEPPRVGLHLSWIDAGPVDSLRDSDRQSR